MMPGTSRRGSFSPEIKFKYFPHPLAGHCDAMSLKCVHTEPLVMAINHQNIFVFFFGHSHSPKETPSWCSNNPSGKLMYNAVIWRERKSQGVSEHQWSKVRRGHIYVEGHNMMNSHEGCFGPFFHWNPFLGFSWDSLCMGFPHLPGCKEKFFTIPYETFWVKEPMPNNTRQTNKFCINVFQLCFHCSHSAVLSSLITFPFSPITMMSREETAKICL